ncbi:VWA domain-containing protein, partial [Vibrio scophthalmi]|uniref:VWA domain-containing protein n=1 Tax=Vibrio scophthalmi TaxID=45658 RepID=UPI0022836D15
MSEFVFLYPIWLVGVVGWLVLTYWLFSRRRTQSLIAPHLAQALNMRAAKASKLKYYVIALSGVLAFIALAGPSFSQTEKPSFTSNSARVLILDMSLSMYANDIQPNRLSQARYKAMDLLKQWREGSTGLVVYSADAYLVSPLTNDTNTLISLIPSLSPAIMPYQGADAASGVKLAIDTLVNAGFAHGDIVLISDDLDNHETQAIDGLIQDSPWRLSILGVGSSTGAPIPLPNGSLLENNTGNTVVAKTDFGNMQQAARLGNGIFVSVQPDNSDINAIATMTNQIESAEKSASDNRIRDRQNSGYWFTLVLIIPALFLFRRGSVFAVLIALPLLMPSPAAQANPFLTDDQQAHRLFEQEEYQQAADLFKDQRWKGAAQYQAGDYENAIKSLQSFDDIDSQYNLANSLAQAKQYQQAIDKYEQVLATEPNNQDALRNLETVKKVLEQQQQQNQP